jgi:hypothetical protein
MSLADDFPLDPSLDADRDQKETLRRVAYAPGMLLGLEATRAEQDYHRRRLTRHAYWLHGCGTVAGLRVILSGNDPGNPDTVVRVRLIVTPGVGVDGLGREVTVPEPFGIDLGAWLTVRHKDPDAWGALIRDGLDPDANVLWLKVTMRYQDGPGSVQPVMAVAANAGTDPVSPSRTRDGVLFELFPERPPADTPDRPFAAHSRLQPFEEIIDGLTEAEKDFVERSGDAERRRLKLSARLLHALGDDNKALEPREHDPFDQAAPARVLLARISVQLAAERELLVNPRRIAINNLVRPFVLNAQTLAQLFST